MARYTTNLGKISNRLDEIESLLFKIEENTHQTDEVKHVERRSVDQSGQKVIVYIRTNILKIGDIDGVKQEFNANICVKATWREPALKGKTQNNIRWDETWEPRIIFFNCATIENITKHSIIKYEVGDDIPKVQITYNINGVFKENMELEDFPFDKQELSIVLLSDWSEKIMTFKKNEDIKDSIRMDSFDAAQSWKLKDIVYSRPLEDEISEVGSHLKYPKYCTSVYVTRKPGFYMWNVLLIVGVITLMSFASLAVDPAEPADRLSVTLTLLLTSVAFKFVVSQGLPQIAYVTLLDIYLLFCVLFQCLMVVQNSLASVFTDNASARRYDWICVCAMVAIIVLFHVVWLLYVGLKIQRRNAELGKLKRDYAKLNERINDAWQERKKLEKMKIKSNNMESASDEDSTSSDSSSSSEAVRFLGRKKQVNKCQKRAEGNQTAQ